MKKYPKIETLFERNEDFNVILTKLRRPVIGTINNWIVTEKIDGMNIRVHFDVESQTTIIAGRSDKANIPGDLSKYILDKLTKSKLASLTEGRDLGSITLYGEGYGAGIQRGDYYRSDKGFILFDVLINDKFWLDEEAITGIAHKLGIPRVTIIASSASLADIIRTVEHGFCSWIAQTPFPAEGIVAKPLEPLYDKRMKRIIVKLKTCDFKGDVK